MPTFPLFFLGFVILLKGADILIDGATAFARFFRVPSWVVGVTVVSIGTSIPEFSVALISAFRGESDIGLGTIIGSNTFNILVILGIMALIAPVVFKPEWVRRGLIPNFSAVVIASIFAMFSILGGAFLGISRQEGFLLLAVFFLWLLYAILRKPEIGEDKVELKLIALPLAFLLIIAGLLGVFFGARWVVDGAIAFARLFGVSEALIGLTLVGIGTSFAELVVSTVAYWKKNLGIAIGNIVGSNIFDFLGILGTAAIFRPVVFEPKLYTDIFVTAGSVALLGAFLFLGEKFVLKRWQGLLMIAGYIVYLVFLFQRG